MSLQGVTRVESGGEIEKKVLAKLSSTIRGTVKMEQHRRWRKIFASESTSSENVAGN